MSTKIVNGVRFTQTTNPAFPSVHVSLNSSCHDPLCYGDWTYATWTMYLQRRVNGTWTTIGTRTGYVSSSSPSHRTFTNVRKQGPMRVMTMINSSAYHDSAQLIDHVI
ncbi:hypothetical protein ACFSKI_21300 [Pseudogracilibacillus auburnensis]|uniref:Uncharacterized protein n=1 Tax=Pseudogracilibacillus auburnensis TaxID=1494959 RepID=A0A2V3VYJ3_9BACI|nr:hypothetical protein [Pseudogracilibacillus auburnensis]PXW86696.1 hypothetical protein DFR56_107218 [Pseudogracilibacillus auburnensis]